MFGNYIDFRLIGDPHATKKFQVGVPIARKGEREEMLMQDLENRLQSNGENAIVMVGDLFEHPLCSISDAYRIISMILNAAKKFPNTKYIMNAGNHDVSPQLSSINTFDILKLFHQTEPNLYILTKPMVIDDMAIFPWEWDRKPLEQLEDVRGQSFKHAIGHWDLVDYSGKNDGYMCPASELIAMGAEGIYSGHWHLPGIYYVDDIPVFCTGSMQPMSHSQDPEGKLYITLTLDEYLESDQEDFKDKYVRVVLTEGQEVDKPEDCLGFKVQKAKNPDDIYMQEIVVDDFDLKKVIEDNLEKYQVRHDIQDEIKKMLSEVS